MLTLNLQIKFRNAHRPKILTVNILLQIRARLREEKLEIVKIFVPKSTWKQPTKGPTNRLLRGGGGDLEKKYPASVYA